MESSKTLDKIDDLIYEEIRENTNGEFTIYHDFGAFDVSIESRGDDYDIYDDIVVTFYVDGEQVKEITIDCEPFQEWMNELNKCSAAQTATEKYLINTRW